MKVTRDITYPIRLSRGELDKIDGLCEPMGLTNRQQVFRRLIALADPDVIRLLTEHMYVKQSAKGVQADKVML